MWVAVRAILAIIGFVVRTVQRRRTPKPSGSHSGLPYFLDLRKARNEVIGFKIGMPIMSSAWIRLHREMWIHRLTKRMRVSSAAQTGDPAFDATVYITCDHPYFGQVLAEHPELRAAITAAFDAGYNHIQFDGSAIWMDRSAAGPPSGHDLDLLKAVHDTARPLEARLPSRLADWFVWKALLIETVIWVIFAYAFIAFLRFYIRFVDIHTYRWPIVIRGLAVAIILLPALLAIVYKWMRGPRGQLIIAESWALLLIGLPISTIQLVADTNRKLDDNPPVVVTHTFDHCEKRAHRRERAIWYSFHMWLRDPGGDPKLPSNIRVPENVCRAGTAGDPIEITIGKGLWGVPHYREIRVRTTSWEP